MGRVMACGLAAMITLTLSVSATTGADEEVPAPFAPFETMVGGWKGTARPAANKVRGWPESHSWAWKFVKGTPVGMTLAVEGGKVFAKGELSFDAAKKTYTLAATDPEGKPVIFNGAATPDGKGLVLDRSDTPADGKERLTIRPNSSGIRYTMLLDRQAPGAPQYKNAIEVGLTKDGESFAAGGGGADLPKCILTGGAAGMTVTYNGKSYPICCTGCRDEFNENPEKYVARAAAKAAAEGDKPAAAKPAPAAGRGDGDFEGLVEKPQPKSMPKSSSKTKDAPAEKSAPKAATKGSSEDRASRDLKTGQTLERAGKTKQAVFYYKDVVKKYPDTEAAKTAAERIKALEQD